MWALMVFSIALTLLGAIPASATVIEVPPLLMTEFAMNPSGTDYRSEYVEIYNCTSEPINLKDYKLAYQNTSARNSGIILFNEITKYAKYDIQKNGKVEPEQAMIEPGKCAVIWIKGNSGDNNASEWTTEDFLAYYENPADVNMFIAEHDITSSNQFVNGGNFYMVNNSGDAWIYLYLVRKEATVDNWQSHIISGFESPVAAFATDSYVHLQFDPTNGLTKVYSIVSGGRNLAKPYLGIIMEEQDPFFGSVTTTTPEETTTSAPGTSETSAPETSEKEEETTTAPPSDDDTTTVGDTTTAPGKKDDGKKSCKSTIGLGVMALLLPVAFAVKKRKR